MKSTEQTNLRLWLNGIVITLVLLGGVSARAQNEVKSADLTQALRVFIDNMNAAQTAEQAAHSKAVEFMKAAEAPAAQVQDTNLPPQTRFDAHAKVIELKKSAVQAQLEAARQSARLLAVAKESLGDIRTDLGGNVAEDLKDLPSSEDQPKVDAALSDLNFTADATIESETADALAAARSYYDMASKGAANGPGSSATFQTVARRLKAWDAKNRRTIVLCDAALKRLELAAVLDLLKFLAPLTTPAAWQEVVM